MINLEAKNTHVVFDEYGMAVVKGDSLSWRDSIGRTVLCWIAYDKPDKLANGLNDCFHWSQKGHKLYRHPDSEELSSRDHWSYFIIHKYLDDNCHWFDNLIKYAPRMRGMNLWMKSLTGKKGFLGIKSISWYYFWNIPFAYIGNAWLWFSRKAGKIRPERENNEWCWGNTIQGNYVQRLATKRQKLWGWIILNTIPAFSLHIKAWQIYVLPKTPKRDALCKILIKRVGKSNIMLRLLYEVVGANSAHQVTQEEIDAYPHMTNYRPGVYLDESCRRDIREMTVEEAEFNTYEKSLIQWLYENT